MYVNKRDLFEAKTSVATTNYQPAVGEGPANKYNLPVPENSPNVSSVLIHYFFTGKLQRLDKVGEDTKIIYANADPALPSLLVTSKTRVHKITPPYETNSTAIDINTLKAGQIIDISAEFDIRNGTWFILDVFLATDRN
jgi:hypothetical protein